MSSKKEIFPRNPLLKYLGKREYVDLDIGKDAEVSDKEILAACKKHLQSLGYLPSEWENYLRLRIQMKKNSK